MNLNKDWFWDGVAGAESHDSYIESIIPKLLLKKEVPLEVKKSVEIVRKLLVHAYFEYSFLDPAMAKVLTTFEMALQIKYKELGEVKKFRNLQSLMYWFNDNQFFEFDRKGLLDALRNIRNDFSHPEHYFGGGFGIMRAFDHCIGMINDLYVDKDLRIERNQQKSEINANLKELLSQGGFVVIEQARYIIYDAEVLFIDNVNDPLTYHYFYKTIFKLENEEGENDNLPFATLLDATYVNYDSSNQTMLFGSDKKHVIIESIRDEKNLARFNKWKNAFEKSSSDHFKDIEIEHQLGKHWVKIRDRIHFRPH